MDGMREAPSDSKLPTFFRWCLGGMASIASGSASRSASERVSRVLKETEVEYGDIAAAQEELLARAPVLDLGGNMEEAAEVFSTPPDQDEQSQPQQGQGGKVEDAINMCTQPFTQPPASPTSSASFSPSESEKPPRKPRVCTRKIRANKIRTPTPSPSPSSNPNPNPSPGPPPRPDAYVDPLYKAFLMIPSAPLPPPDGDILELALKAGIFQ